MNKTDKQTLLVLSITIAIFIALFVFGIKNYDSTPKHIEKVRVDSISTKLRYPYVSDDTWYYHTEKGVFTSNKKLYNVGDSIPIQIIKIKK